jgi:VWFA-related protein
LSASFGCKGSISQPPAEQPPAEQPPPGQPALSPEIVISSRQIASGNVVLNTISEQTVSLQNSGSGSLTIGQIAQANTLASPFSIVSDNCSGRAVQPSAACSFNVRFSPTSQGAFNDNFDIPSNAANENSVAVDVTGSGKALRAAITQVKTDGCSTGILELIVAITDQTNAPLSGLTLGEFQLTENGVSQPITGVSQILTPVPVSVATVLDYSGSIQGSISTIEAASKFFVGLLNADDEAAIIKFATTHQLMQDFTGNKDLLITAIDTAASSIGLETHLYDTLWFGVEKTAVRQKARAIVVITDGKDQASQGGPNVSVKTPAEVIAYATANAVAIYTVGLGDSVDVAVLNRLASETGGQFYPVSSADQLAGVYQAIRNILSGKYSVQYVSSLHGGSPITLTIDVLSGADEGAFSGQFAGCP